MTAKGTPCSVLPMQYKTLHLKFNIVCSGVGLRWGGKAASRISEWAKDVNMLARLFTKLGTLLDSGTNRAEVTAIRT